MNFSINQLASKRSVCLLTTFMMMAILVLIQLAMPIQAINLSLVKDEKVRSGFESTWKNYIQKNSENRCCLPDTYSLSMTNGLNRKNMQVQGVSMMRIETSTVNYYHDRKTLRMRIDSNGTNAEGQVLKTSQITFRLGEKDFEYNIVNGACSCRLTKLTWDKTCYSLEQTSSVGKIGDFEATNVFVNSVPNQFFFSQWTVRSKSMDKSTCFPLSIEFVHDDTSLLQNAFNQATNVDPSAFRLPLNCPVFSSCQ